MPACWTLAAVMAICAELIVASQDDHVPVEMFHKTLYQAKLADQNGRVDGKQGNIFYVIEKRC